MKPAAFPELVPFAARLKALRFERRLTQAAVAKAAGISTNHYQSIETNRWGPTLATTFRLAAALDVSAEDLVRAAAAPADIRLVPTSHVEDLVAVYTWLASAVERIAGK